MPEQGTARTWMTIEEVATRLEVTTRSVNNYIKKGELEAFKMGGRWRITEEALQKFIASRKNVVGSRAA